MRSAISKVFGPDIAPASEGIAAKLEHRLLSSKVLSKEVSTIISSLSFPLKPTEDNEIDIGEETTHTRRQQNINHPAVTKHGATPEASQSNTRLSITNPRTSPATGALGSDIIPDQELGDLGDDTSSTSGFATSDDHLRTKTSTLPPRSHSPSPSDGASHSPLRPDGASQSLGAKSIFLPTLSNGFIPGGSDTDWSDGEARVADGIRKNRRGQRARRA
jgi:BUD22